MMFRGKLSRSFRWLGITLIISGLLANTAYARDKPQTVDEALMAIESVDGFPQAIGPMIDAAKQHVAVVENVDASKPAALLGEAAKPAFDPATWRDNILAKIASPSTGSSVDADAFIKASQNLVESYGKAAELFQKDNKASTDSIADRLKSRPDNADLEALVSSMALPDMAAETTTTTMAMTKAIEIFFNEDPAQFAKLTTADIDGLVATYFQKFNVDNEDIKPQADLVRQSKKIAVEYALSELSQEDIKILLDFYKSDSGQAKREALIKAFNEQLLQSNKIMLKSYFVEVSAYFRSKAQQ
ncbi:hypothetical protein [Rhizobium paknamense]|uniref:DUF2059 domain-containing protein n=1 Tax=Rhizobium paknamense TaxID=1206817 RepID=A0ABU0I8N3_9HYPH|nr:hypothetical protein [Rhizobium paknamense]MDQ0454600.1 hypothetical protein [Rhizobium paknamense]